MQESKGGDAEDPSLASESAQHTLRYYANGYHREHYDALLNDGQYYDLVARFWRYSLFQRQGLDVHAKVLDFGSGIGQVSAALSDTICFDISSFAVSELRRRGRIAIENRDAIPKNAFDYVLSSHSLEHSPTPFEELREMRGYVRPHGKLVLVLPIETNSSLALESDWNLHLFCWNFQTITNLLRATGWTPESQSTIRSPFMLRTLGKFIPADSAAKGAYFIGRLRRSVASMLTIARVG